MGACPRPAFLTTLVTTAACALAAAVIAHRLYPHELPPADRRTDLLATVFYDPAMVFAGRVAALSIAAFAVLSILARIWNREWLTKAGPFEVEHAAATSERERDDLKKQLAEARGQLRWYEEAARAFAAPTSPVAGHDDGGADNAAR